MGFASINPENIHMGRDYGSSYMRQPVRGSVRESPVPVQWESHGSLQQYSLGFYNNSKQPHN